MLKILVILLLVSTVCSGQITRILSYHNAGDSINAIGDYSSARTDFYFQPKVDEVFAVERLMITIADEGIVKPSDYGAMNELLNGVKVAILDVNNNIVNDMTNGYAVRSNAHWAALCFDVNYLDFGVGESGVKWFHVQWIFSATGSPLYLDRTKKLAVILNDDFTGLTAHVFIAQMTKQ